MFVPFRRISNDYLMDLPASTIISSLACSCPWCSVCLLWGRLSCFLPWPVAFWWDFLSRLRKASFLLHPPQCYLAAFSWIYSWSCWCMRSVVDSAIVELGSNRYSPAVAMPCPAWSLDSCCYRFHPCDWAQSHLHGRAPTSQVWNAVCLWSGSGSKRHQSTYRRKTPAFVIYSESSAMIGSYLLPAVSSASIQHFWDLHCYSFCFYSGIDYLM